MSLSGCVQLPHDWPKQSSSEQTQQVALERRSLAAAAAPPGAIETGTIIIIISLAFSMHVLIRLDSLENNIKTNNTYGSFSSLLSPRISSLSLSCLIKFNDNLACGDIRCSAQSNQLHEPVNLLVLLPLQGSRPNISRLN